MGLGTIGIYDSRLIIDILGSRIKISKNVLKWEVEEVDELGETFSYRVTVDRKNKVVTAVYAYSCDMDGYRQLYENTLRSESLWEIEEVLREEISQREELENKFDDIMASFREFITLVEIVEVLK
jgi:hypothetical protein